MKKIILTLLYLFVVRLAFANTIDSLQTDQQVLHFVRKLDKEFTKYDNNNIRIYPTDTLLKKAECQGIAKQWDIKNWEKTDFNQDGKTDLLVYVYWYQQFYLFAIVDNANNTYTPIWLTKSHFEPCQLAKPIRSKKQQLLLYYAVKHHYGKKMESIDDPQTDTLIYKYGNFVERNVKPAKYKITSVHYETQGRDGLYPFDITIAENGGAVYHTGMVTEKGTYQSKISADKLKEISSLINYISIKNLKDDYLVDWFDDATCYLTITFSDGSTKHIRDYGMQGTFGLSLLYNKLTALKESENWRK